MKLESAIQAEILGWLNKQDNTMAYKHYESPVGFPDVAVLSLSRGTIYLEIKRSKKHKPRPIQKYMHEKIRKCGGEVYVVWSLKMVKDIFPIKKK